MEGVEGCHGKLSSQAAGRSWAQLSDALFSILLGFVGINRWSWKSDFSVSSVLCKRPLWIRNFTVSRWEKQWEKNQLEHTYKWESKGMSDTPSLSGSMPAALLLSVLSVLHFVAIFSPKKEFFLISVHLSSLHSPLSVNFFFFSMCVALILSFSQCKDNPTLLSGITLPQGYFQSAHICMNFHLKPQEPEQSSFLLVEL